MNPSSNLMPAAGLAEAELGSRVAKNTGWLLLGRLGSQGLALLFSIVIARRLGEVGLGQYAFIASVVYLGNLATTFGTDMLIMREVAAKRDPTVLPASLIVQLALALPFILLVFLLAPLIPNQTPDVIRALYLYSLALLPLAAYSVFSAALRGLERMAAFTWLNLFNGFFLAAAAWFFVQPGFSIEALAGLLLAVQLLSALAAMLLFASHGRGLWSWQISWKTLAALLVAAAPIAALGLLGALYQRMGIYLLATLQGAAETGLFSAALRVVEAAKLGHFALLGAVFPLMAQAQAAPHPKLQKLFAKTLKLLLLLAGALAVLLFLFSPALIPILFGAEFSASVPLLNILAWLLIPVTLTHYFSLMLLSAKKEKIIMLSLVVSLAALLTFVLLGLPALGPAAVAWGLLLAESLQAAILVVYWLRNPPQKEFYADPQLPQ